jgi:hypothetical protein
MNVTLPVGVPEPEDGSTLAVKVTLAPRFAVAALALSSVAVESSPTETANAPELLARFLLSPP